MTVATDPPADWGDLIDRDAFDRWAVAQGLGPDRTLSMTPIGGGTQNILLHVQRGGRDYVLRRPPLHPRPGSDEAIRREIRVLAALADTDVPHARLIAGCDDVDVLGTAFYLMERVDGFNAGVAIPSPHADDPNWRRRMGEALVDGAVALARVDPEATGLSGFGRLDGWLERQVQRWNGHLDGYAQFDGWTGRAALPDIADLCGWLEAYRPAVLRPGLIHGDYHFANVLFRRDSPDLAAIVDWELCSLGDPLLDLGWLVATWADAQGQAVVPVMPWTGFPSVGEIVDRYLTATGRSAAAARWFAVLACFKLGVLLEGTHARAGAGLAPKATGDRLHISAISLFERGLTLISSREI